MKTQLDLALCERWPAIFADRQGDPAETAMCRGFECGDGWYPLIDTLCAALQREADRGDGPQPVATQVKDKLGRLRFRLRDASERQRAMLDLAADLSERVCDRSGVMRFSEALEVSVLPPSQPSDAGHL